MQHFVEPIVRGWFWPVVIRSAHYCNCPDPESHADESDRYHREDLHLKIFIVSALVLGFAVVLWVS